MWNKIIVVAVLFLVINLFSVQALNLESAKESKCFPIKKTVSVDPILTAEDIPNYYPLMSRYDLFMSALGLSGKSANKLGEDEIYNSCITVSGAKDGFLVHGFRDIDKYYGLKPVKGWEIYQFFSDVEQGFKNATCYDTFTDNKTFTFTTCCDNNDQMSWGVTSPYQVLPNETVEKIFDHAVSLGFKREYFTALEYNSCDFNASASSSNPLYYNCFNLLFCYLLLVFGTKIFK